LSEENKNKKKKGFRIPERFIISHKKEGKNRWDIMVLILAIYNSLQIPFYQAFNPKFFSRTPFIVLDSFVDFVFIFDIILSFFTSIINNQGVESFDSLEIAIEYVSQFRFYTDVLSSFGASFLVNIVPELRPFGYIKLLRVFRLGGMISRANIDESTKALLNLSKLIFYLVFYLHLVGCYLFLVTSWNAPQNYRIPIKRNGDDCWYQHKNGNKLMDSNGKLVPCDEETEKWVLGPTFGDGEDPW
jgi:hypothetical protein